MPCHAVEMAGVTVRPRSCRPWENVPCVTTVVSESLQDTGVAGLARVATPWHPANVLCCWLCFVLHAVPCAVVVPSRRRRTL